MGCLGTLVGFDGQGWLRVPLCLVVAYGVLVYMYAGNHLLHISPWLLGNIGVEENPVKTQPTIHPKQPPNRFNFQEKYPHPTPPILITGDH